jgi:hypothetical protein
MTFTHGTRTRFGLAAAALLLAGPVAAQTASIDTRTGAAYSTWGSVGYSAYASNYSYAYGYGQTFRAPTNGADAIQSFSFDISRYAGYTGAAAFRAYLMAWDEATSRVTGGFLWQSDLQQGPTTTLAYDNTTGSYTGWETRSFNTGGITLNAGQTYVAFLSSAGDLGASGTNGDFWTSLRAVYNSGYDANGYYTHSGSSYTDGSLVEFLQYSPSNPLTAAELADPNVTRTWVYADPGANGCCGYDAGFTAQFGTTDMPEPASLAMLGIGLVGVARTVRRRKQA